MKYLILVFVSIFISCSNSYNKESFRSVLTSIHGAFPETYQIASVTAYYDKAMVVKPYTFLLETKEFSFFMDSIMLGEKINSYSIDKYPISLYFFNTKSKSVVDFDITVNIQNNNISIDGVYFEIDVNQFKELNKNYSINYTIENKRFADNRDFAKYILKNVSDTNLIFYNYVSIETGGEIFSFWKD